MKITAIICALLLSATCLFGCSEKEDKIQTFVDRNQDIEEICSNVYCSSELTARDSSVVLTITMNNIDDAGEDSKQFFNEMMDEIGAKFLFDKMKKEERSIKSLIIEFCETDGDVIASYEYK